MAVQQITSLTFLLAVASAVAQQPSPDMTRSSSRGSMQPSDHQHFQPSDVVQTTLGPIRGLRKNVKGRNVDVYYGIPFAKPPVGARRFKHPEPAEPWTEVRNTVTKPNSCFQVEDEAFDRFLGVEMWNPNTPMSEDCLHLNVWVPRGYSSQPPKATMVWIFGGGFWAGTSTLDVYDGSNLASTENVIVVSMNYRLGALGFLYTATDDAPGNQGLMDQVMALKWVYNNVVNFGGAQETITIFGESAGAVSVGLHLMSPRSMNYFTRAIMQSASPTVDWGIQSESQATVRTERLASSLGCPARPVSSMVRCLQRVNAQNITATMWSSVTYYFELPFAPVVDNNFLLGHPKDLLARGEIKDTEIIIGANKDEGIFWLLYYFGDEFPLNNTGQLSRSDFKDVLKGLTFDGEEKECRALMYEYVDSIPPSLRDSYRDVADDMSGDDLFKCPAVNFAAAYAALSENHDVYLYSFEHRLSNNPWPAWTGVMHGYEIEAIFGLPRQYDYTSLEEELASRVTNYWTRFAQTGDPNGVNVDWPKLTPEQLQYLKITDQGDTVHQGLRHRQCSFRNTILPLLEQDHTTNEPACQTGGQTAVAPSYVMTSSVLLAMTVLLTT